MREGAIGTDPSGRQGARGIGSVGAVGDKEGSAGADGGLSDSPMGLTVVSSGATGTAPFPVGSESEGAAGSIGA